MYSRQAKSSLHPTKRGTIKRDETRTVQNKKTEEEDEDMVQVQQTKPASPKSEESQAGPKEKARNLVQRMKTSSEAKVKEETKETK